MVTAFCLLYYNATVIALMTITISITIIIINTIIITSTITISTTKIPGRKV